MKLMKSALGALLLFGFGLAAAQAEPMKVEAVLTPKEQMRLNFEDGSKHFVLLVRREGKAEGSGPLNGASVTEFGMHDIIPGVAGDPRGYLEFTDAQGGKAYVKWLVRAIFVPGDKGKPKLIDYGFWELAGGTGQYAGMKGAGSLQIKPAGPKARRFILDGELVSGG